MNTPDFRRVILHVDANNFYASCECAKDPTLLGKPIVVAGDPEKRQGIVLAKNYMAKKYDIKTGDTVYQATRKCPDLVVLAPDFETYSYYSSRLFDLYCEYTDRVESFGMDECWLDVTGSIRLFGSGEQIANSIRERAKAELGLTVSVGVSFTKVFAKLGSDYKKPDATTVFDQTNYKNIVWSRPAAEMLMVGTQTSKALRNMGIRTIGDIANLPLEIMKSKMGLSGVKLWQSANGIEFDEVALSDRHSVPKSISNGSTTCEDMVERDEVISLITTLCDNVATRMRKYDLRATSVYIGAKTHLFATFGGSYHLPSAVGSATELIDACIEMMDQLWADHGHTPLRAITVGVAGLFHADDYVQTNLTDSTDHDKLTKAEQAVDAIRSRYGKSVIKRGTSLSHTYLTEDIVDDTIYKPFKRN